MAHKRNPVLSILIRSAALQVPAFAQVLQASLLSEHERAAGAWHAEWLPLRECLRLTGGATETATELLQDLEVHPEKMHTNLALTGHLPTPETTLGATPTLITHALETYRSRKT
jgi:3-carboxy-cis,cis-muconate cycloisomerase